MNLGKLRRIRRIATDDSDSRLQEHTPQPAAEGEVGGRDGGRWPEGVTPPW